MTSNGEGEQFEIDCVGWHTQTKGNPESREKIEKRFRVFATYLQDHGLTARRIPGAREALGDDFAIHSKDLTAEGMAFVRAVYDKWLKKIDNGMSPDDVRMLDKALAKLRG